MAAPSTWACWLGSVAILAALPGCALDQTTPKGAHRPENQAQRDLVSTEAQPDAASAAPDDVDATTAPQADSAAGRSQHQADVPQSDHGDADVAADTTADSQPAPPLDAWTDGDSGVDVWTGDVTSGSVDVILDTTSASDVGVGGDVVGGDVIDGDVIDGGGLADSLSDTSGDAGAADSGGDINPWLDSKSWPLYAVDIVDEGLCGITPPNTATGVSHRFCRADWSECTVSTSNLVGPCGWIHCCNLNGYSWDVLPGCPHSLKTYTGVHPTMFCPPVVDLSLYESKYVPLVVPQCCPKFVFKWP